MTLPASGQTPSVLGPVSGFVFRPASRSIQPFLGVPGSAHIGSAVWTDADFASVAPDGKWAVITRSGHSRFVRGLSDPVPAGVAAAGQIDGVDRVLWNRDASYALLYSSSSNLLQRVRLSGDAPGTETPLDLSPWGAPSALALDPSGAQIAFGVTGSGLYLLAAGQSPALISSMQQPAAAAFDVAARRLYAVDLDQQQIWQFDSGSNAVVFASLGQSDVPLSPAGLAVSGDGRSLLLADSAAHAVRVYDTTSASLANTLALDFTPTRFEPLSQTPRFLLNGDRGNEWLLVLEAGQTPAISFVPASQEGQ
jgi:hypothetical protein